MSFIASVLSLLLYSAVTVSSFQILSGESEPALDDLKVSNTRTLMQYAAFTGEDVTIMMNTDTQTAILQHHVHVVMDCSPLLRHGERMIGHVTWTRQSYVEGHNETLSPKGSVINIYPSVRPTERLKSEGSLNHILNISWTNALPGPQKKDNGVYKCTACTSSGCRFASVMLFLIGAPPRINAGKADDPPEEIKPSYVDRKYRVGSNFCVNRSSEEIIQVSCDIVGENLTEHTSVAFPFPARRWYKDDVLLYSIDNVGRSVYNGINQNFFNGQNAILKYGIVEPPPLFLFQDGEILLAFEATELAFPEYAPPGTTNLTVIDDVFDALTGRWRCEVENVLGKWMAETVITECD